MIHFRDITAVLITKEKYYPPRVLESIIVSSFNTVIVQHGCEGVYRRFYRAIHTAYVYVQDDDAICPIEELAKQAGPDFITCAMKPHYIDEYANLKCCLIGWGAIFPAHMMSVLNKYLRSYENDYFYKMGADRIFTALNFPQKRLPLPITDMPWALDKGRMSMQADHYEIRRKVLERCESLS